MVVGAALTVASGIAGMWLTEDKVPQYLRVADDNFEYLEGPNYNAEDGPMSAKLIRDCKIDSFTMHDPSEDSGSSFVKIDGMPKANLNCLIGEARIHSMSIAIVDGIDRTATDCLGGWPTRFQEEAETFSQFCLGSKNPNPIFVSDTAPKR